MPLIFLQPYKFISSLLSGIISGILTFLGGPYTTATTPKYMWVTPDGNFAYATNSGSNTVSQYAREPSSGALVPLSTASIATGVSPTVIVGTSDGKFVFVLNTGTNTASISSYSVNATNGQLTNLATTSVNFVTNVADDMVIAPSNDFLYVVSSANGAMNSYTVNATTGAVGAGTAATASQLGIATNPSPLNIIITADGLGVMMSGSTTNLVYSYTRNPATGFLTYVNSAGAGTTPKGMALSSDNSMLYVTNSGSASVTQILVNPTTKAVSPYGGPYTTAAGQAYTHAGSAQTPDGRFVFVSAGNGSAATLIYQYSRSITGQLTALSPATVSVGVGAHSLAMSSDGLFLYAAQWNGSSGNTVYVFSINQSTGLLTAGTNLTGLSGPKDIAITPDGKFCYITNFNTNTVNLYSRNAVTGVLSALSPATVSVPNGPSGVYVSPDGANLYVNTFTTTYQVISFSINATTGALTSIGSPINVGIQPFRMTMPADGTSLYVANSGANTVSGLSRNTSTGLLTFIESKTLAGGYTMALGITPNKAWIYAVNTSNSSVLYAISRDTVTGVMGTPTLVYTGFNGGKPGSLLVSQDIPKIYFVDSVTSLMQGTYNQSTGSVTLDSTGVATGTTPIRIVVSSDGTSAYVSNSGTTTVSQYASTGNTLSALSPTTVTVGTTPTGIVVSPDGNFVYAVNAGSNNISTLSRNSISKLLTSTSVAAVATGAGPTKIAISPDGLSAYVTNFTLGANTISAYNLSTSTGVISAQSTPTLTTGTQPFDVAVTPDNKNVYVTNNGANTISQFSRDLVTGSLSAVGGTYNAGVATKGVVISADGSFVYTNSTALNVTGMFKTDSNGYLSSLGTIASSTTPTAFTISPNGLFAYASHSGANFISQYAKNATTGVLTALSPTTQATNSPAYDLIMANDGTNLYLPAYNNSTVNVYSASATTGLLTVVATTVAGANPTILAKSPDGNFIYATNQGTANVSQFSRTIDNDTYYSNTKLYLRMNTATFTDNSTTPKVATNTGLVTAPGTVWKFDGNAAFFNNPAGANTCKLTYAGSADFNLGTTYTVETWLYPLSLPGVGNNCRFMMIGVNGGTDTLNFSFTANGAIYAGIAATGTGVFSADGVVKLNEWQHYALVVNSGTASIYKDGILVAGPVATFTTQTGATTPALILGFDTVATVNYGYNGYMDEFRLTKGVARYTTSFTPQTATFPTVSGDLLPLVKTENAKASTALLMHMDGTNGSTTFIDMAGHVGTAAGTAALSTTQSKFGGSSLYLSGASTANRVSFAANTDWVIGSGPFTIELWAYLNSYNAGGGRMLAADGGVGAWNSTNGIHYIVQNTSAGVQIQIWSGTAAVSVNVSCALSQWNHIAFTYDGTTLRPYVNGVLGTPLVTPIIAPTTTPSFAVGAIPIETTTTYTYNGYIDDIRIVKGTALYTGSTFTVPSAPYDLYSNDIQVNNTLLMHFDNNLTDSALGVAVTNSGTTFSNTVSKFGGYSLNVNGGYALVTPATTTAAFGTGDFTVEGWVYPTSAPNAGGSFILVGTVTNAIIFGYQNATTWGIAPSGGGWLITSTTLPAINTWSHIAITRKGGTLRMFLNGLLLNTVAGNTTSFAASTTYIGHPTPANTFPGYLDELRVTTGYARYTNTFTVPNAPFASVAADTVSVTTQLPTVAAGTTASGIAITSDGTSAYVANSGSATLSQYSRNVTTGALSPLATIATGTSPNLVTISPDDLYVYVMNYGASSMSIYSRNITTGVLALSATMATAAQPFKLAISSDGTKAYLSSYTGGIAFYRRNTSTGALTEVVNTIASGTAPQALTSSADGNFVYCANFSTNNISQYSRNSVTGQLTALSPATLATGTSPVGITASPDNAHLYSTNYGAATIAQYSRNTVTGLLSLVTTTASGTNPANIVISPDGLHAYVTNLGSATLSQYSRNISTGQLTALTPATVATGTSPWGVKLSVDGTTVYVTNNGGNTISEYSRDLVTGLLTPLAMPTIATLASATPKDLAVSPNGNYVYVVNTGLNSVSSFRRY